LSYIPLYPPGNNKSQPHCSIALRSPFDSTGRYEDSKSCHGCQAKLRGHHI